MTDPASHVAPYSVAANPALRALVAGELTVPVAPAVTAMAAAVADEHRGAARTVLFYGSCLRLQQFDGLMLDFYLIVSDYRAAYDRRWLAHANAAVPPNVFPFQHDGLAAKYAVLSEEDLARFTARSAPDASVWARFAQPARLVWSHDAAAAERTIDAVTQAPDTLAWLAAPIVPEVALTDPLALWRHGFGLTYAAELRAERGGRPDALVDFAPDYYRSLTAALTDTAEEARRSVQPHQAAARWRTLRRVGKRTQVLRLAKATATFAGGIDYLAWKINRHAGTQITIKPWQRRWPLVAALFLVPRLLRRGAIR